MARALLALLILAGLTTRSELVRAEPPPEDAAPAPTTATEGSDDPQVAQAREAFKLGTQLAHEARWDEARVMFARSNAFKAHPVTLYNIAYCDRAMGRPARALELFQKTLDAHEAGPDHLPEALVGVARRYLAEASARVARVRLLGLDTAGLAVDGRTLQALAGQARGSYVLSEDSSLPPPVLALDAVVLLDPGTHVFVASKAGYPDAVQTRALAAGEELSVTFEFRAQPQAAAPATLARPPVRRAAPALRREPSSVDRRYAYAAFGVGALGAVVGSVAGVVALRKKSELSPVCGTSGDECPKSDAGSISTLRTAATASTVAFAIGAVGALSGVTLLVLGPKQPARRASIGLELGFGQARLVGQLR